MVWRGRGLVVFGNFLVGFEALEVLGFWVWDFGFDILAEAHRCMLVAVQGSCFPSLGQANCRITGMATEG